MIAIAEDAWDRIKKEMIDNDEWNYHKIQSLYWDPEMDLGRLIFHTEHDELIFRLKYL